MNTEIIELKGECKLKKVVYSKMLLEEKLETYYAHSDLSCYGLFIGEILVGLATVIEDSSGNEINLECFEVFEKYQDRGYGIEFIKQIFNFFQNVTSITGISTEDAEGFYFSDRVFAEPLETCDFCDYADCNYRNTLTDEFADYDSRCDDYNDRHFRINRDIFLKRQERK